LRALGKVAEYIESDQKDMVVSWLLSNLSTTKADVLFSS
jgi:hypothetical protein